MADNKFAIGTVGFNRILFGIMDDKEQVTKVVAIDGNSGGAVELKTSGFQGQSNTVYGSNIAYYVSDAGTGTGKVEITAVELPSDVATEVLGDKLDNGILETYSTVTQPYCAVIAEAEDLQGKKMWIGIAKAKFATVDADDLKTSENKGKTPNNVAISGSAITRRSDKLVKAKGSETSGATFETFVAKMFPGFKAVNTITENAVTNPVLSPDGGSH